jgi:histidine phosphotransfer protein HptB
LDVRKGLDVTSEIDDALIDWDRFAQARAHLGGSFWRVMGYLRDDGHKAVGAIETSLRAKDAAGLIGPAELLKTEALQMGAFGVAEIAEEIELQSRECVEWRQSPDFLLEAVVKLRTIFEQTVSRLEQEASPLLERKAAISRSAELATR